MNTFQRIIVLACLGVSVLLQVHAQWITEDPAEANRQTNASVYWLTASFAISLPLSNSKDE